MKLFILALALAPFAAGLVYARRRRREQEQLNRLMERMLAYYEPKATWSGASNSNSIA